MIAAATASLRKDTSAESNTIATKYRNPDSFNNIMALDIPSPLILGGIE
jgi:hypothetical protein